MLKPNLSGYNKRDLQTFLALLYQFDQPDSQKDISYIRNVIQEYVDEDYKEVKLVLRKARKGNVPNVSKRVVPICPSCKKGLLHPIRNNEGLNIWGCSACRYSEVKNVK